MNDDSGDDPAEEAREFFRVHFSNLIGAKIIGVEQFLAEASTPVSQSCVYSLPMADVTS